MRAHTDVLSGWALSRALFSLLFLKKKKQKQTKNQNKKKNPNCPPQINTFVRTLPFHTASGLSEGHHLVVSPGNAAAF